MNEKLNKELDLEREYYNGLSEDLIKQVYKSNGIKLTNSLLKFEKEFSGIKLPFGSGYVEFKIIRGGGFPFDPDIATIEVELKENEESGFLIKCADIGGMIEFYLDAEGRLYKDFELIHNSFEEFVNEKKDTNKK